MSSQLKETKFDVPARIRVYIGGHIFHNFCPFGVTLSFTPPLPADVGPNIRAERIDVEAK